MFATEDTSAQVCWRGLPPGTVIAAGPARVEVDRPGPGAASLEGLPAGTGLALTVARPGRAPRPAGRVRTLVPPPGRLLCRFATVNDLHVGETRFGLLRRMTDEAAGDREPYPLRCARAALAEAAAWGAEAVVAKGDLTYSGRPHQWEEVGRLLAGLPVPVAAVLGNHDVGRRAVDGRAALAAHGIDVPVDPWALDLPGLRVVLLDTTVAHHGHGRVPRRRREQVGDLLAAAPGAALLAMHHHPERGPRSVVYPPGIPPDQSRALLDTVAEANPATLVATGHSHVNRRRRHGPLVVVQVGATMHYPGSWAGYAVHEGGIRQVVRRVADPDAMAWTERTRRGMGGLWGLYAPGLPADRSFSHTWPPRA